jgi:hypothetical protein
MVCIVCLKDEARNVPTIMLDSGNVVLCGTHYRECEQVIKKWIRENREKSVVDAHDKAKEARKK